MDFVISNRARRLVLAHLGPQGWMKSSYIPGRSGYVFQSPRPLLELRADLCPRYACRLAEIHAKSGKFFLEPSWRFLARALTGDQPWRWWSDDHQSAAQAFFLPWRADRIRRCSTSPPSSKVHLSPVGFLRLRDLALRLEALAVTPRPDKHWRGLAKSFDDMWQRAPLHSAPLSPLGEAVFDHLNECRQQSQRWLGSPMKDYGATREGKRHDGPLPLSARELL